MFWTLREFWNIFSYYNIYIAVIMRAIFIQIHNVYGVHYETFLTRLLFLFMLVSNKSVLSTELRQALLISLKIHHGNFLWKTSALLFNNCI